MSNLKYLVPPVDLCQQIPEGAFTNSVFVWSYSCDKRKTEPFLDERDCIEFCRREMVNAPLVYPAPTLQEILEGLPTMIEEPVDLIGINTTAPRWLMMIDGRNVNPSRWEIGYAYQYKGIIPSHHYRNYSRSAVEAAMLLWLKVHGIEVTK